jgi:hypothetical protein
MQLCMCCRQTCETASIMQACGRACVYACIQDLRSPWAWSAVVGLPFGASSVSGLHAACPVVREQLTLPGKSLRVMLIAATVPKTVFIGTDTSANKSVIFSCRHTPGRGWFRWAGGVGSSGQPQGHMHHLAITTCSRAHRVEEILVQEVLKEGDDAFGERLR